jgi:hypothetical protein
MKRIQYIVASLFILLSITSCEVEEGIDVTNQRTLAGKYIFDRVQLTLESHIYIQNKAVQFDAYLQAEESEKKDILRYLLPDYKFMEKGDTVCFYTKTEQWDILRASTDSLSSPSASWSMGFIDKDTNIATVPFGDLTITRNDQRDGWIMDLKDLENNITGEGSFEVKKLTDYSLFPSQNLENYSITTVGSTSAFVQSWNTERGDSICLKYQITKPFYRKHISQNNKRVFVEGAVEIDIVGGVSEEKKQHVSAEIDQSNYDFVTIQFKGLTERVPQVNSYYTNGYNGGGYGSYRKIN